MKVEETLDKVIITIPRETMLCNELSVEFSKEVNQLKEKYGQLKFIEYCENPKDFTYKVYLAKEI